jgi:hypothetical protein
MVYKIAADVPQWVLDEFAKVRWDKIPRMFKGTVIKAVQTYANKYIPYKQAGKSYKGDGSKKMIAKNITQDVIDMLNLFDFNSLCENDQIAISRIMSVELKTNKYIKPYLK